MIKLGVVMDPIAAISYKKDSTLAMLLEAKRRGWSIYYIEQNDLFLKNGKAFAKTKELDVFEDPAHWFAFKSEQNVLPLSDLNIILMRKDPPFNNEYIYSTYILESAESEGVLVVNKPQSLRDANEKVMTMHFPQCCPATLITRDIKLLRTFLAEEKDIVCKPLDGMGGESIFRVKEKDENTSVVFEVITQKSQRTVMAQRYIPEIKEGDKRIIMIDGEPIPYALARIPASGELRGNLVAGGKGIVKKLSAKDQWICEQVAPYLKEKKILFAGIDVIGDYLTEINITSPTCIREIEEETQLNIASIFFDVLVRKLN